MFFHICAFLREIFASIDLEYVTCIEETDALRNPIISFSPGSIRLNVTANFFVKGRYYVNFYP